MTVDVEEHFQVSALAHVVPRESWEHLPSRVASNTERLLELLARSNVRATFFVLGWIARRDPALVRRIAEAGHEIGCHGWAHELVYRQTRESFSEETQRAKSTIEQACGRAVAGYRAASFSITRPSLWALDVLAECGFAYDSSVFPVVHDRYGLPGAPRSIYRLRTASGGSLVEIPPSTLRLGRLVLPAAGGGYLRLFPTWWTRWVVRRLNRREGLPAIVYVHPWEVDPEQPRFRVALPTRLRHYGGLHGTAAKLRDLWAGFGFGTLSDVVARSGDVPTRSLA
jgi:polysaccharide deacetylase family protein (PEP-CTERM system associated)